MELPLLRSLQHHWSEFRLELVAKVELEHDFNVYTRHKSSYSLSYKAFDAFLVKEGLDEIWKQTELGCVPARNTSNPAIHDAYLTHSDVATCLW